MPHEQKNHHHLPNIFHRKHHCEWSYEGNSGPQAWSKMYPNAKGMHQSPININTDSAVFDARLLANSLCVNYQEDSCHQIKNTGHTFQVDACPNNKSTIKGGPVNDEYRFIQFHMHWGDTIERGSEHLINDEHFAAELHFVNWNHTLYSTPEMASNSNTNDGLVVMAKFVKVGQFNFEFEKLSKCMEAIHLANQHVNVDHIDIMKFLSKNLSDYWTYSGSLTTPPCTECVQWIIFKEPLEISKDQLENCHKLYEVSKDKLCNENTIIKYNDRPICNLNSRIIRKSFD